MQQILNQNDSAVILEFILIIHVLFEFHFAATEWNSCFRNNPQGGHSSYGISGQPIDKEEFWH